MSFEALVRALAARAAAPHVLRLRLEELSVRVRSNSEATIADLRGYFAPFLASGADAQANAADIDLLFLDGPVEEPPVALATRPHLPGKRPDKERAADLPGENGGPGGRVVRKQATGMLFVFGAGPGPDIALGPCARNRNQLVNFLCARYMERRVAAGWALGHAAGVVAPRTGRGLALCGFCGMGKSTLALHLVARGCDFLSNDRVLVEPAAAPAGSATLHGIPKHPRLNPGTALGNPELTRHLAQALPEALRRAYADSPPSELYAVEDKYDAIIDDCFGPAATPLGGPRRSRFRLAAPLAGVVVLNWRHGGGPCTAQRVDLAQRPDLLSALRKPPGVFYLTPALARARLTPAQHLEALCGAPALELCGGSDFSLAASACLDFISE
ncbi:MAG: hypothetical protein AUJ49_01410 [Desulfovibrionaceae bacterium CG1_02_65_16]|nr:MAG: hypothetical protein AUJ49_01410 [Desulfovibrionaceae bacterium CG1_02_65_16]